MIAALLLWASGLDHWLHDALRLYPSDPWPHRVAILSSFGGIVVMGPVAVAVCAWLLWRRRRAEALWLFASIAIGRLLVEGSKLLVLRARPPLIDRLEIVNSWSFPSSHSAGTMMTGLAIAIVAGGRTGPVIAALAVAAVIGWSRIALGVHWASDVVAGLGFGLAWIGLARLAYPRG
jgi:undecaprenyl-diphosphatase